MICDTCELNSQRYEIINILSHTVIINRKTVKLAKSTICDTLALTSTRCEISDILSDSVVVSSKTVKSAKNTICDTCANKLVEI